MASRAWIVVAAVAAATVAGAIAWLARPSPEPIDVRDPRLLAQGRSIYERHCASCHGAALEGQPDWRTRLPNGRMPAPPHDASGHTWHHPSDVLLAIVSDGVQQFAPPGYQSDMPAYRGVLSDVEIRAVLAWIKSTWPEEIRARHDQLDRAARSR